MKVFRHAAAPVLLTAAVAAQAAEPRLEEVIVTAGALRKSPLEVAQPTAILAGDDLRRQIAASIGETLSRELGVTSSYFGPTASRPVIRGLGGYRVQILDDGISSLDVSSLSQDHAVSLESVVSQQIEIIKGPAALLYGSGAAGGLVNIVSNRIPAETDQAFSATGELRGDTATEERTWAASLGGGGRGAAWHLDAFDRDTDDVESFGSNRVENSWSETTGGAAGLSYAGDRGSAGAAWSRYESQYGIPSEEEAFIDMKQDRYDVKLQWNPESPAIDAIRLRGAYNDYTHTEFEAPAEPGTVFNQDAYEARLVVDHRAGTAWRGTVGLQYLDIDLEAIGDEAFVPASVTRATSLFTFQERTFGDWTLELGARAERQTIDPDAATGQPDFEDTAVSVSMGAVWKFRTDHALAVNVTRTERNPQATELYANGPHLAAQRFEIGNPGLDKEAAVTADVSLRRTGGAVEWILNAYYNDYTDYIFEAPTGAIEDGLPVFVYGQADATFRGFEAALTIPLFESEAGQLALQLSSDYVRGKLDGGGDLPQIPPLRFGVGLHYERDRWHGGLQAFYYDRQDKVAANELPTGSFTMLDADLSYRLPLAAGELFVFLRGTNLLDEEARQHASPLKEIAPLPGRSLQIGLRAEL